MRGVIGEVNDSCYMQFGVEVQGVRSDDIWGKEMTLLKGSTSLAKGKFRSNKDDFAVPEKVFINYKDVVNNVQIILVENKLSPLSRVKVNLPKPEKYNVSDFFLSGYFDVEQINVISMQKTVPGAPLMKELIAGKKVNLLDRVFIEKMGEPLVRMDVVSTSLGEIRLIRNAVNIEI